MTEMQHKLTGNIWDGVNNWPAFVGQSISSPHHIGSGVGRDLSPWNRSSPLNGATTTEPSERASASQFLSLSPTPSISPLNFEPLIDGSKCNTINSLGIALMPAAPIIYKEATVRWPFFGFPGMEECDESLKQSNYTVYKHYWFIRLLLCSCFSYSFFPFLAWLP